MFLLSETDKFSALAITPSHQQNTHVFADGRKNMNATFNDYVCSASHLRPGLRFQNVLREPWFCDVTCPAPVCRSGSSYFGKFSGGSNSALVFESVHSRPETTFSKSWHDYPEQFWNFLSTDLSPRFSIVEIQTKLWCKQITGVYPGGISRSNISITWGHRWWHCWQNMPNFFASMQGYWHTMS